MGGRGGGSGGGGGGGGGGGDTGAPGGTIRSGQDLADRIASEGGAQIMPTPDPGGNVSGISQQAFTEQGVKVKPGDSVLVTRSNAAGRKNIYTVSVYPFKGAGKSIETMTPGRFLTSTWKP